MNGWWQIGYKTRGKIEGWHLNFLIICFGKIDDADAISYLWSGKWGGALTDCGGSRGSDNARGIVLSMRFWTYSLFIDLETTPFPYRSKHSQVL